MNFPQIARVARRGETPANRLFSRQCFQNAQRLSKTLHRDHAQIPCIAPRLVCVIPSRGEEDVRAGTSGAGQHYVPDQELSFDITPRNLNLGR